MGKDSDCATMEAVAKRSKFGINPELPMESRHSTPFGVYLLAPSNAANDGMST